jgi:hypothetical protein
MHEKSGVHSVQCAFQPCSSAWSSKTPTCEGCGVGGGQYSRESPAASGSVSSC